ncbi:MAG: peptidoglycan editing factor PgeF [Paraperlucidibaca sp.]
MTKCTYDATLLESQLIRADWPAPAHVQAWVTTRAGGVSAAPFDALNLGRHVSDDPHAVNENRQRLTAFCQARGSIGELQWLNQVHGIDVLEPKQNAAVAQGAVSYEASKKASCSLVDADASSTAHKGLALVVMTADCLPVFFTDTEGLRVAVAHAGWRGLCNGVLEATAATFAREHTLMAWLGPAIGPASFEVGESVRDAFLAAAKHDEGIATRAAFTINKPGHYLADLYALARLRLMRASVSAVYGGGLDTFSESSRFFSYRREAVTGRLASVMWRN